MDYLDILGTAKIAGFILTALSSAWALTQKLTVEGADGRKHLTTAGWGAIVLIVVGTVTSLFSFDLENRKRLQDAATTQKQRIDDAAAAQKRDLFRLKQLIAAGQPVTSFEIEWRFKEVAEGLVKAFDEATKEIDELPDTQEERFKYLYGVHRSDADALVARHLQLYPFLRSIASPKATGDVVVLISLDNTGATLVPIGVLDYEPSDKAEGAFGEAHRSHYIAKHTKRAASGVDYTSDLQRFYKMDNLEERRRSTPYGGRSSPALIRDGKDFVIRWRVDAASFLSAIDRAPGVTMSPASLPDTLKIMVLHRIFDLPAYPSNFAVPKWYDNYFGDPTLFVVGEARETVPFGRSTIRIVPNEMQDVAAEYDVEALQSVEVADNGPETQQDYCSALILVGKRKPAPQ